LCKWFTWFCEKIFEEFEARDFLVIIIVGTLAVLIIKDKLPMDRIDVVITTIVAYALGRPSSFGGKGDE